MYPFEFHIRLLIQFLSSCSPALINLKVQLRWLNPGPPKPITMAQTIYSLPMIWLISANYVMKRWVHPVLGISIPTLTSIFRFHYDFLVHLMHHHPPLRGDRKHSHQEPNWRVNRIDVWAGCALLPHVWIQLVSGIVWVGIETVWGPRVFVERVWLMFFNL